MISMVDHHLFRRLLFAVLLLSAVAHSQPDLALAVRAPASDVAPRQTVNLVVVLENRSEGTWEGLLQTDLPPGWRLLIPPAPASLAPGESVSQVLTLLVPRNADAGVHVVSVRAASSAQAEARITVSALAELKAVVLQAPELVVANPYKVTFLLSNGGNLGADLTLSVDDNLGLPLVLQAEEISLPAGETREVVVSVDVPADLSSSAVHRLTLTAEDKGGQKPSSGSAALHAMAVATVDLIPLRSNAASAYHTFPLRLEASAQASLRQLADGPPLALDRAEVRLSGEGKLWDRQPGTLRLQLGTGSGSQQQRALLEYRSEEFRVALGRQRIVPTPLFPQYRGIGLSVGAAIWPTSALRMTADGFVLAGENESNFGVSSELTLEESLRGSLQLAATEEDTHFGMRWQILADPASASPPVRVSDLDVGYAVRVNGTGQQGRALWLAGGVAAGPLDLEVGFKAREGSYADQDVDSTALSVDFALGFGALYPSDLSVRYRANRSYALGSLIYGPRPLERYDGRLEVELDGTLAGTELGLEYLLESQENLLVPDSHRRLDRFSVSIGTFFEADEQLQQRIALTKESDPSFQRPRYSVTYVAGLRTPSLGGNLTSEVDLRYSMEQHSFSRLDVGTEWSGPLQAEFELRAAGRFGLVGDRVTELEVEGRYAPDDKRRLTVELLGTLYRSRSAALKLKLAFVHAFDVAVTPLSTVGSVAGRIVDAEGNPLERLVVRIAGRSAATQQDGTFLFPAVPEGTHQLTVHPDTLSRSQLTLPATPLSVQVDAGSELRVELRVVEAARLQGSIRFVVPERKEDDVVYGMGRPEEESGLVSGILLELTNGETVVRAVSDKQGSFQFAGLPPGRWRLAPVANHLPDLYRIAPSERTLDLVSGVNEVVFELLPAARPIRIFEGGVVESGEETTGGSDE